MTAQERRDVRQHIDINMFRWWLHQQQERSDAVGEFARAAMTDDSTRNFGSLIGYWVTWSRSDAMETAVYDAMEEYDKVDPVPSLLADSERAEKLEGMLRKFVEFGRHGADPSYQFVNPGRADGLTALFDEAREVLGDNQEEGS